MKVFWFFFSKKNSLFLARGRPASPARKRFSLKPDARRKEAKTSYRSRGLVDELGYRAP
jgi:hypothetical protein